MGGANVCIDPLLKGAPQFIVLSLIVVFAAYLRQVFVGAVEMRNKIIGGEIWNYPSGRGYGFVRNKIKALDKTADALSLVGPLMIWLAVFAVIRIGLDGISKFASSPRWIPGILVHFDLGIAVWLLIIFGMLGYFHFRAKRDDDDIQRELYKEEPEIVRHLAEKKDGQKKLNFAQTPAEPFLRRPSGSGAWGSVLLLFGLMFLLVGRQPKG
jgi:hypothetical protein